VNTTTRNYETLYIVDAASTDEQVESIIAKYSKVITDQGGEVQAAGKWDKRRLAYEVKGKRDGIYILMYFTAEASVSKELDRLMRIADDVMRHLITRVEPQHVDTTRIMHPQPTAEPVAEAVAEEPAAETTETAVEEVVATTETEPKSEETVAEAPVEVAEETTAAEEPVAEVSSEETTEAEVKEEE